MLLAQIGALMGVAAMAHIGNKILVKSKNPDLAEYLDIVITIAGAVYVIRLVAGFFNEIKTVLAPYLL